MNTSACVEPETARDAIQRLFARELQDGFKLAGCHRYNDANGNELFRRVRLKHGDEKHMRPIRRDGLRYQVGEPPASAPGKPLYVPPYPLVETDPVFVVEGEACADALAKVGLTATTSGSASSANAADWTPLRGRSVVVWPDHDRAGATYADDVVERLHALDCHVRLIAPAVVQALPEHGDCVNWLTVNPDATADDIRALTTVVAESRESQARDAPEPLRRPTPLPEPYPIAELGGTLAGACESLRRVIQAPDAVCGASVLAAASLATQGLADVHNDGRVHPLSLWLLTIAESGERKSAVDAEAMRPAREYEKERAKDFDALQENYTAQMAEWESRRDHAKTTAKRAGGSGLADALRKIGPAPPAPLTPRVTVADFTAEGLAKMLANNLPSVGAFTDEAALVFGGHGMTKETITRTAGTLSKLWDSGTLDRVRAGDGAVKLYGRRLALHLMAQPVIAERALSDDVLAGQGFLARCLLAWPESTAGRRPYVAESLRNDAAMTQFWARLTDLHRVPLPITESQSNELAPRALTMTEDAVKAWRGVHDAIEAQIAPGGRYAMVRGWASKAPEQCLRIAGVLTLVEEPDAQQIDAAVIERAAELALWHLNEAVRLAGTAELSLEVRDAEALLTWCHETGRTLLHSRDALNKGPSRIRERARFTQAMDELERAGWAHPVEGGAHLDGAHRRYVWRIIAASEGR